MRPPNGIRAQCPRVDETYIKVKGQWIYLYRSVDTEGSTIDFYLSKTRNHKAAKRFFKKALRSFHVSKPRVITVDKNPAYPIAVEELKKKKTCHRACNSDKRNI
jgi:transposase-like protein